MRSAVLISTMFVTFSTAAYSSELNLKCSTGWFNSYSITTRGNKYFLDGEVYPGYSEKINSSGKLWAKIYRVEVTDGEITFLKITQNVRTKYVSKVDYFILNQKTLLFKEGVNKKSSNKNAIIADWLDGSSGKCEHIEIN